MSSTVSAQLHHSLHPKGTITSKRQHLQVRDHKAPEGSVKQLHRRLKPGHHHFFHKLQQPFSSWVQRKANMLPRTPYAPGGHGWPADHAQPFKGRRKLLLLQVSCSLPYDKIQRYIVSQSQKLTSDES